MFFPCYGDFEPNSLCPGRGSLAQRSEPGGVSGPGFQERFQDGFEDPPGKGVFLQTY